MFWIVDADLTLLLALACFFHSLLLSLCILDLFLLRLGTFSGTCSSSMSRTLSWNQDRALVGEDLASSSISDQSTCARSSRILSQGALLKSRDFYLSPVWQRCCSSVSVESLESLNEVCAETILLSVN